MGRPRRAPLRSFAIRGDRRVEGVDGRVLAARRGDLRPQGDVGGRVRGRQPTILALAERSLPGRAEVLSAEQAVAVEQIATSARVLDVLVGPAGTGKSTTMAGLRAVWEYQWGAGSVIGMAPSSAAAEVLADELGIATENTAKWLTEYRLQPARQAELRRLRARLAPGTAPLSSGASSAIGARIARLPYALPPSSPTFAV
jgi:hypothetical protein